MLREQKEPGCCWVKWCSSAELNKEIVTVTSLFQEGTTDRSGKGIPSDDYKPVEAGGIVFQNKMDLLLKMFYKTCIFIHDFLVRMVDSASYTLSSII